MLFTKEAEITVIMISAIMTDYYNSLAVMFWKDLNKLLFM